MTGGAVVGVAVLGIFFSLIVSWGLSRSVLKGEASAFSLEVPPYRPPRILQTLYTSLIDRTIFVLWRAVVFALPAGILIWLVANIHIGQLSLAEWFINWSDPFALLFGLNGVTLLAYIIAIPANEIVVPTMLMVYMGLGTMTDAPAYDALRELLIGQHHWTMLTAVNLMLFSLLHNPCATTILTMHRVVDARVPRVHQLKRAS